MNGSARHCTAPSWLILAMYGPQTMFAYSNKGQTSLLKGLSLDILWAACKVSIYISSHTCWVGLIGGRLCMLSIMDYKKLQSIFVLTNSLIFKLIGILFKVQFYFNFHTFLSFYNSSSTLYCHKSL